MPLIPGPRPKKPVAQKMVTWHLRESARQFGEEALEVVVKKMRSKDERLALAAAVEILNRGWGKAPEAVDVNVTHAFAEVPQVMQIDDWLRHRGQPQLPKPESASPSWPLAEPSKDDDESGKLN